MAKQGKAQPARRPRGKESLLIRSAESLGRVIGTLQRQLDKPMPRQEREVSSDAHASNGAVKANARSTSNGSAQASGAVRAKSAARTNGTAKKKAAVKRAAAKK